MIRKFAALFALVLTLGLAAAPVAAQDVDADDLAAVGMENGYLRMYLADPNAEGANPELLGVMVAGFEFDETDTLDNAFEDFTCGFAGGFLGNEDALNCDGLVDAGVEVADVDGIGDQAMEITGESADLGPTNILAVQSENRLFLVIYLGDATPGVGDDIGTFLADAEPVDTEVMFSDDGTSTGGFFDMLPQEGDAEIEGLMPMMDEDFLGGSLTSTPDTGMPEDDSTPAA